MTTESAGAKVGVLVVGHGTASAIGADESSRVAAMVAGFLPDTPVELGFLELIEPSIDQSVGRLVGRGVGEIVVAPLLLFSAGHARRDVPEAVRLAVEARGVEVRQAGVLGCHDAIVELARHRRAEACRRGAKAGGDPKTVVVVVGRGSSDPSAPAQLAAFAELVVAPSSNAVATRLGFVAASRPTLDEAVEAAAADGPDRVVIHPHLLFHGHVESQVAERIARARLDHPGIEWVVVDRLGADPAVARAVVDRVNEALADRSPVSPAFSISDLREGFGIA